MEFNVLQKKRRRLAGRIPFSTWFVRFLAFLGLLLIAAGVLAFLFFYHKGKADPTLFVMGEGDDVHKDTFVMTLLSTGIGLPPAVVGLIVLILAKREARKEDRRYGETLAIHGRTLTYTYRNRKREQGARTEVLTIPTEGKMKIRRSVFTRRITFRGRMEGETVRVRNGVEKKKLYVIKKLTLLDYFEPSLWGVLKGRIPVPEEPAAPAKPLIEQPAEEPEQIPEPEAAAALPEPAAEEAPAEEAPATEAVLEAPAEETAEAAEVKAEETEAPAEETAEMTVEKAKEAAAEAAETPIEEILEIPAEDETPAEDPEEEPAEEEPAEEEAPDTEEEK